MNSDHILSIVILLAIAAAVWIGRRQGAANPVGTAKLQHDVTALKSRMDSVSKDVAAIRKEVDAAPSTKDLEVLRTDIAGVRREMSLIKEMSDRTDQGVVRIERILMGDRP